MTGVCDFIYTYISAVSVSCSSRYVCVYTYYVIESTVRIDVGDFLRFPHCPSG